MNDRRIIKVVKQSHLSFYQSRLPALLALQELHKSHLLMNSYACVSRASWKPVEQKPGIG